MAIKHNLNKNDRIILVSIPNAISPSRIDPLWTSSYGCIGTIENICNDYMLVKWDNGALGTAYIRRVKLFSTYPDRTEPNHAFSIKKRSERMDRVRGVYKKPATKRIRYEDMVFDD